MSDIYRLGTSDLGRFITDHVQADSQFLGCCGDVINQLVSHLQNKQIVPKRFRPSKIIKSGSLGKGTAVKNRSDIDLVFMQREYNDVGHLMRGMNDLLKHLKEHILMHPGVRYQTTTRFSIQVEATCGCGHKLDVDILPAVALLEEYSPRAIYDKMRQLSPTTIHEYSVSLVPLQLDIISGLPTKVKDLIKLVKYWKDTKLKDEGEAEMPSFAERRQDKPNWPSSYTLELVVVNAWLQAGEPINFNLTKALYVVLTSLVNHRQFKIVLQRRMKYSTNMIKEPRPEQYIMDPANPYNDMYHGMVGGQAYDWDSVVPEAMTWLGKPLFNGVSKTGLSW